MDFALSEEQNAIFDMAQAFGQEPRLELRLRVAPHPRGPALSVADDGR